MAAYILSREWAHEGEEVVGVFDTVEEAKIYADEHGFEEGRKGPWGDCEHIREFHGAKVLQHFKRGRVKYGTDIYSEWKSTMPGAVEYRCPNFDREPGHGKAHGEGDIDVDSEFARVSSGEAYCEKCHVPMREWKRMQIETA